MSYYLLIAAESEKKRKQLLNTSADAKDRAAIKHLTVYWLCDPRFLPLITNGRVSWKDTLAAFERGDFEECPADEQQILREACKLALA